MTLKSDFMAAVPIAGGVVLAGLVMYYLGSTISLLNNAAKGFTGATNATTTSTATANTGILATLTGGLL